MNKPKNAISMTVDLYQNRSLVKNFSKNDFKTKFAGSYLGIVWAFVQPIVTILVYWFVFEIGLKAGRDSQYPFIVWLTAGLVPWFFFSEAWSSGTNALIEYSYLVKKVVFKISILPFVKVISSLFVHMIFVGIAIVLSWAYGYTPDFYTLQLLYYILCSIVLTLGLSYLTSAVAVFFRDLKQIINILLQVGVWMTPIMWNLNDMIQSQTIVRLFKLNPVYYIVDGFRNALLDKVWFWEKPVWTIGFWFMTLVVFWLGVKIFEKVRVYFADVL